MITKSLALQASTQQNTATTVTGAAHSNLGEAHELMVIVPVTAVGGGAGSGDLLKVLVDTSFDGGTTWVNIGRCSLAGNVAAKTQAMAFSLNQATGTEPVDVTSDIAADGVRQIGFGDQIRYRGITTGTGPDFTYSVTAYVKK